MSSNAAIPAFAAPFPPADEAQWRALVDKVLKGGKFERLVGKTADGIAIQPLYQRAPEGPRALARRPGGWDVLTRIDFADPATANAQAKAEIAAGAAGLHFVFAGSAGAHGFGLADGVTLKQALEGIDPATTAIELDLSQQAKDAPEALAALVVDSGLNPASARISFGIDPIGGLTLSGANEPLWRDLAPVVAAKISALAKLGFAGPFCVADGRIVHAAGGSEAQELAYVLSTGVAYLRALEAAGDDLPDARARIGFRLAADADQFATIAKFRALRLLWARIEEKCGLAPQPISIHAETAWRMMSRRDPHVNLLRATVAVFSAATGGADRISVLPFTQAVGLPDAFARRLARNTQLVLQEEANIARVADPAAGSGAIETLTGELSAAAWAQFRTLEKDGGIGEARVRATLAADIAAVHAARLKMIATRREPLTGVSEFPNIHEAAPDVLAPCPDEPAAGGYAPLRNAQGFERLRERAETLPTRPRIFLANFGPLAAFNARATFARNLFEAGGIEAIANDGFADAQAMAAAFAQSGAKIACICSSDALYADSAPACAQALINAGAKMIWLAGRPGEDEQAQRAAGVARYAFAGCDAAALLEEALDIAG